MLGLIFQRSSRSGRQTCPEACLPMHFDDLPNFKLIVICIAMLNVQKVSEKNWLFTECYYIMLVRGFTQMYISIGDLHDLLNVGYWMLRSNPLSSTGKKVRKSMASMQSEAYKLALPWNGLPKERTIGPAMPKRDG